jgi:DnaA family protein
LKQLPLGIRLRERALFSSFVAGENRVVLEQLRAMARPSAPGARTDAPLAMPARVAWLCGPPGVGKSHLLQAVCAERGSDGALTAYLPLAALRAHGPAVLEGWQDARLLAIDELAIVAGNRAWEQALFSLYRESEERGATLIAAAIEPPTRLPFALPDLASRFAAASVLSLRALDEAGQRAALRLRAHARGLELPEETAIYLQRRYRRDLRSLYELLDTIDEAALQAQRRLTVPFIREVLGSAADEP